MPKVTRFQSAKLPRRQRKTCLLGLLRLLNKMRAKRARQAAKANTGGSKYEGLESGVAIAF